ncbi:MAG: YbdK family carboxylate-amine ligase [Pirellulales bacterium]|nr:YbdK family carboxylate-amine ligase [Pirellulales bacterium]
MTLGVEEEFQLLCPKTLSLIPGFDNLAACWRQAMGVDPEDQLHGACGGSPRNGFDPAIILKSELHQCCCEVVTKPCSSISELDTQIRSNRKRLIEIADHVGIAIGLSGTHPYSHWNDLPITREPKRLESEYLFQEAHRQCLAFALHIHVGIPNRRMGLYVMNDARALLPILYALSCSSPFLEGRRTGLKSSRVLRAFGFPRTGIPDALESLEQLDSQIRMMEEAGLIADAGQLWWDIRLHHTYPTVEFRIADAVPRVRDVMALAALAQVFVADLIDAYQRDIVFDPIERWILCENRWRAARFGTESELIDCFTPSQSLRQNNQGFPRYVDRAGSVKKGTLKLRPVRALVTEICDRLLPVAQRLGSADHLEECLEIATHGSAADRQLAIAGKDNVDLRQVVQHYRQETADI